MKLIDCFMYFDDDLVLDIRLNTLYKHVDQFIIAEATLDHAGNEKKMNFDIKKFSKFKDKINYLTPYIPDRYKEGLSKKIGTPLILEINFKEIL